MRCHRNWTIVFCAACNFYFFGAICMFFFSRVFPLACILQPPLVVSKFFSRGIYMDRLFFLFPRSLINIPSGVYYKAQWLLFFFAKYYVLMRWIFAIACMTPVLGRIQKLRHVFNAQLIFLDTSIPNFWKGNIFAVQYFTFTKLDWWSMSYQYNLGSYPVWTPVVSLNAFSFPSRPVYKQGLLWRAAIYRLF